MESSNEGMNGGRSATHFKVEDYVDVDHGIQVGRPRREGSGPQDGRVAHSSQTHIE